MDTISRLRRLLRHYGMQYQVEEISALKLPMSVGKVCDLLDERSGIDTTGGRKAVRGHSVFPTYPNQVGRRIALHERHAGYIDSDGYAYRPIAVPPPLPAHVLKERDFTFWLGEEALARLTK